MPKIFSDILKRHKVLWPQKTYILNVITGLLLLIVSLIVNNAAKNFATAQASNYVSDLILDNLPVVNVDFIFFEGFVIFWLIAIFFILRQPHKLPFVLKSIGVFIIVRSIFITLTHLAVPPYHSYLELNGILGGVTSLDDLFFSSHTGLPYLLALGFWENKRLRIFFIMASIFFGIVVLLGHLHYSIDVFAAYFITYGIFQITKKLFPLDYRLHTNS